MAARRTYRPALVAAAAAVVALAGAHSASATVVDAGTYNDSYSFTYNDCGYDVDVVGTSSGHFRVRAGKGKTASAFFVNDNYSYRETHTNPETGAFVTITANAVYNEIKATRVSGNVFEFEAVEAGQPFRVYDSAGRLVVRDRGSIHHHFLFDTLGDDVPGGEFVGDLEPEVHGPHPGFDDFCGVLDPLIGS